MENNFSDIFTAKVYYPTLLEYGSVKVYMI